jgi:hypothetical protein
VDYTNSLRGTDMSKYTAGHEDSPAKWFILAAALMLVVWAIGSMATSAMTERAAEQVRRDMGVEQ